MKASKAINAVRNSFEPLTERLADEVKPFGDDFMEQLLGSGARELFPRKSGTLGKAELDHARHERELEAMKVEDDEKSKKLIEEIKVQYAESQRSETRHNQELHEEIQQLSVEVVQLAREAGVDTKIHLQNTNSKEKVSTLTIKLIRKIISTLRFKASQNQDGSSMVSQRNGLRSTGMLAWVSGKQMKIHEQGTMQLQG